MTADCLFDHDKLDAYRLAVEYAAKAFKVARALSGQYRHARDQWLRAAQSIALNIAEGNGKRSPRDRARFLDIARGSVFECAAIQDVLVASDGLERESSLVMKRHLRRIASMLTRLAIKFDGSAGSPSNGPAISVRDSKAGCAERVSESDKAV
jgi:four helix bundle protein